MTDPDFVTWRDLASKVDETYDALDGKIQRVADKLDDTREQTARDLAITREQMVADFASIKAWVKYWPIAAVALGTVGGEQIAQALIR